MWFTKRRMRIFLKTKNSADTRLRRPCAFQSSSCVFHVLVHHLFQPTSNHAGCQWPGGWVLANWEPQGWWYWRGWWWWRWKGGQCKGRQPWAEGSSCVVSLLFIDEKNTTPTLYNYSHPIIQTERSCNDSQRSHPACWAVLLSYLNWLANWSPNLGTRTLRVLKGSVWQSPTLIFPCPKKNSNVMCPWGLPVPSFALAEVCARLGASHRDPRCPVPGLWVGQDRCGRLVQ